MKISAFTFLRNALINGYPFEESIKSVLPIVDEFVCVIGESADETLERVLGINSPKIRIIQTVWNESMRDRGFVYGQQKMIGQYNCTGDWAIYLEGDEVFHEDEVFNIREMIEQCHDDLEVEALYFDFLHFYGSPSQVGIAGYRRAPRVIRNTIRSYAPDGLFWVVMEKNKRGRYPKAKHGQATIYHYGHCRSIKKMAEKVKQVGRYWGKVDQNFIDYGDIDVSELRPFDGEHPAIMSRWLNMEAEKNFVQNASYKVSMRNWRNRLRFWLEGKLNLEFSKKHYRALD